MTTTIECWCFTEQELQNPKACTRDDFLLATGPGLPDVGVFITRDGKATNQYGDGVFGVTKDHAEEAEIDESPYSEEQDTYADTWKDVEVDEDGKFVRFAPKEKA